MASDELMLKVVVVGVCIFAFLAIMLVFGFYYGGDTWNTVAQGVAKFIIVITVAIMAFFVIIHLAGRR